jgi:uncharacterized RDD family membrane protein YckC
MFCPQCGTSSPDEARFCGKCGAALPTPDAAVTLALPLADYGARVGGFVIDFVAAIGIYVAVSPILGIYAWLVDSAIIASISGLLPLAAELAVFGYFWAQSQSPGKAVSKLQVVDHDGRPTSLGRMLVREILLKGILVGLLWLTLIGPIIWYLWPLWDKQRRAPHDIILGTFVVRKI